MIDLVACKQKLLQKEILRQEKNRQLWGRAQEDAENIVAMIVDKYEPLKIYQWGSVLNADHFQEGSDIDIALEGVCEAEKFFSLLGDAMKMTDFPLDIVQMEKIMPEFADVIRMKGRIVYER